MEKLFLLDASGFLYRNYFAIRNMTNPQGESTNALFGFVRSILKLFKDFNPGHLVAVFDGPHNTKKREALYSDYKAHRAAMPPDLLYQIEWARKVCELLGIPQLTIPEVEADDTIGSIALWAEKQGSLVYLCTSDKDMAQLVTDKIFILNTFKDNLLLNPQGVESVYGVPPHKIVDLLSMVGDASDNVPGLPGFGEKTAASLLNSLGSLDYILAHPEEVPGQKKQETIRNDKEKALLSRQLVTLDTSVEFPQDPFFFQKKSPHIPDLKEFFARMNFQSLLKEISQWQTDEKTDLPQTTDQEKEEYILIENETAFEALLEHLKTQKEICFYTAATHLRPMQTELVGIGLATEPKKSWYIPLNGKIEKDKVLAGLKPLFENPKIGFYGHNTKYEKHVLANYGIKVPNVCFDTILASYILNSGSRQHSLEALFLHYFDKVKTPVSELIGKGKATISLDQAPIEKVCAYCCEDVDYTSRLKGLLQEQLEERKLTKLLQELELPLMSILMDMERRGIFLETNVLNTFSHELHETLDRLEQEIYGMAGEEFNVNSPKQLQDIFKKIGIKLIRKTATGFSTDADVLEDLSAHYPIAEKILEYRGLEKLRSTYVETLPREILPKDNRIHTTFNQSVAATGRLSCQDPNLQNIPAHTPAGLRIREAFRPQKTGWSYLAADYSQVELRLLAHLSEDPVLVAAFNNNEDIHRHTASAIYNTPLIEVTKEQRQNAKAVNFGVVYGQQAWGLAKQLKIDPKTAAAFIDMYFKKYRKVKEYLDFCKEEARRTGKTVTLTGRERPIPEINSKNGQIRSQAERLAINTPIQGTAADLIKIAMLKIEKLLLKQQKLGYMILQIHDELIFEIPDFEIIDFTETVRETMEGVFALKVPLVVDIAIGKNWKEC
jgi:DNA polymerase-1